MIKLEPSMYKSIKDEYFDKILQSIKTNTKYVQNASTVKYFNEITIDDFFKTDNEYDDDKIKKIIFADFENLLTAINEDDTSHIKNLKNYFRTACLIHFSKFDIVKELKNQGLENTEENKIKLREKFVEKYYNPWIEDFKNEGEDLFLTEEKFKTFIQYIKVQFNSLNKDISTVINYSIFKNSNEMKGFRHKIITSSGISVCPYCDRQYITPFKDNGDERTTADLDHFYPKSVFSLFALSLYNFIPSCKVCNQSFKRDKPLDILYPFKAGFGDDAKFTIDIKNIDALYGKSDEYELSLSVDSTSKNKHKILNNIEMFHLESVYQHHKSYVKELLIKGNLIYTDSYLSMMSDTFKNLNLTNEDLQKFLYGYDFKNDKRDKTLGKLTKDTLEK